MSAAGPPALDNEGTRPLGGAARSAVRGEHTSPPGRPEGEYRSATREGTPLNRAFRRRDPERDMFRHASP